MARTIEDRISAAQDAFEKGFLSNAARKRALDELNRAYSALRDDLMTAILKARTPETEEQNHADYWGIPSDLHQVRDRHFDIAARYSNSFAIVRDLISLREAIKAATIEPRPVNEQAEKVEAIRRSIIEEMEFRKASFVEGLDISRRWNEIFPRDDGKIGLPISVNAHLVYGHKGAIFIRHFFYLSGKLTPLNTIIAIAERLEHERNA